MQKKIKKIVTIITSASLTCGISNAAGTRNSKIKNYTNAMTKMTYKNVTATKPIEKGNYKKPLIIAGLVSVPVIAVTTGIACKNSGKNSGTSSSSTSSSSPNTSFSNTSSHNNSFQIQPAHAFKDPNKLNYNVQDENLHSVKLNDFITVSVWSGCITRIKPNDFKGLYSVMSPDNEGLNPGLLAGAIANDAFGHQAYDDQQQLLKECAKKKENNKEEKLLTGNALMGQGKNGKYAIAHVVGPKKEPQDKPTDEQLKLLKSAYYKGMKKSLLNENLSVNVCPISDGSYGFTTTESFNCFKLALKELKQYLEFENGWKQSRKIQINLVIHPDYNNPSEGGSKTKTDIAINMLNSLQKEIENEQNKENKEIKEVQIVVDEKSKQI